MVRKRNRGYSQKVGLDDLLRQPHFSLRAGHEGLQAFFGSFAKHGGLARALIAFIHNKAPSEPSVQKGGCLQPENFSVP